MKTIYAFIATVVITAAVAVAIDAPEPSAESQVGRYQIAASSDRFVLVDTMTGRTWSKLPGRDWRPEDQPPMIDQAP